jgi:hypothetical protein
MIKIVSGFSIPVGSTMALVNLCNQFNDRKHDCILYGPDHWHMDKCKSANISDFYPEDGDIIIVHKIKLFSIAELYSIEEKIEELHKMTWFKSLKDMVARRLSGSRKHANIKLILSCQENDLFPIRGIKYSLFDKIHYVNASQIKYHKITHPHFVCPNFSDPLGPAEHKPNKVAGVVGSIRKENQTDISIEKALQDGMESVTIYGYLFDPRYYYDKIVPLTRKYPGKIRFAGFIDNRQKLYDSLSDVYCTARKSWNLVNQECRLTGTRYHGPDAFDEGESMTNEQIYDVWKHELGL